MLCLEELLVRHMLAQQHYLLGGEHTAVLLLSDVDHILEEREGLGFKMSPLVVVHLGHQSLGHGHIVVVPVAVGEAQGGYVRLLHKVLKLVKLVHCVHCYKDCTDPGTGEEEGKPVRHIGCPHSYVVAPLYSYSQKSLCQKVHTVVELGIGKAQVPVRVDQELVLRVFFSLVSEHLAQSHIKHGLSLERCVNHSQNLGRLFAYRVEVMGNDGVVVDAVPFGKLILLLAVDNFNLSLHHIDEFLSLVGGKVHILVGIGEHINHEWIHVPASLVVGQ